MREISGPVGTTDAPPTEVRASAAKPACVEITPSREAAVGQLAYLGVGRAELVLLAGDPIWVLLLGGEPFAEPVLMWWNFVARGRDELDGAYRQWESGDPRFGRLRSPLARIPAPRPFWARPTGPG